jgi:hypothetical protein
MVALFLVTPAVAPATAMAAIAATAATSSTVDVRKTFFTCFLLTGGQLDARRDGRCLSDPHSHYVKLSQKSVPVKGYGPIKPSKSGRRDEPFKASLP